MQPLSPRVVPGVAAGSAGPGPAVSAETAAGRASAAGGNAGPLAAAGAETAEPQEFGDRHCGIEAVRFRPEELGLPDPGSEVVQMDVDRIVEEPLLFEGGFDD